VFFLLKNNPSFLLPSPALPGSPDAPALPSLFPRIPSHDQRRKKSFHRWYRLTTPKQAGKKPGAATSKQRHGDPGWSCRQRAAQRIFPVCLNAHQTKPRGAGVFTNHAKLSGTMLLTTHLSARQVSVLEAAVNRLIPADDFPSGWEAGGEGYFALLLTREPQFLPLYRQGLDALDAEAHAHAGQGFAEMGPDAQDALLGQVETGTVKTEWPLDPIAFFQCLVTQTMESFYADPGNGGNKNGVSWRMIGFTVTA